MTSDETTETLRNAIDIPKIQDYDGKMHDSILALEDFFEERRHDDDYAAWVKSAWNNIKIAVAEKLKSKEPCRGCDCVGCQQCNDYQRPMEVNGILYETNVFPCTYEDEGCGTCGCPDRIMVGKYQGN